MTIFVQGGVINVEYACFVNLRHETNTIHSENSSWLGYTWGIHLLKVLKNATKPKKLCMGKKLKKRTKGKKVHHLTMENTQ